MFSGKVMRMLRPSGSSKFVRPNCPVGVADSPELLRVAEILRGNVVEALAFGHGVFLQQREILRRRNEAPPQVGDLGSVRHRQAGERRFVITAVRREGRSGDAGLLK